MYPVQNAASSTSPTHDGKIVKTKSGAFSTCFHKYWSRFFRPVFFRHREMEREEVGVFEPSTWRWCIAWMLIHSSWRLSDFPVAEVSRLRRYTALMEVISPPGRKSYVVRSTISLAILPCRKNLPKEELNEIFPLRRHLISAAYGNALCKLANGP